MTAFKPQVYLKSNCPFCFKLVMFLSEAQMLDQVDIIRIEGDDEAEMDRYRAILAEKTGQKPTFPTVELTPGEYVSDSDGLVAHFADKAGLNPAQMPGYQYYLSGLFPAYIARFRELKALKEQLGAS